MDCDYLIVGAGTAGCVLAERLSTAGARIVLLEAGGNDNHMHVRIPAAFPKLYKSPRDWAYETQPQKGLYGRTIFWPRGKMVGGCSSMNAQIHQWCQPADFDGWAAGGAPGWGWADMAPALKRTESWIGPPSPHRGASGNITVAPLRAPNPLTRAFMAAAVGEGLPLRDDYNGGAEGAGVWLSQVAHRNGARFSAADAFLRPALKRDNVRLLTGAHVLRLLIEGKRAVGVAIRQDGAERTLRARAGVVLCAGTVNTPQVLMLSGIGPGGALNAQGIGVVVDAPEVGANLQDHLVAPVLHRGKRRISLKSAESPVNLLRYLIAKRGMLASNVAEALAFLSSEPGAAVDLEILFAPVHFAAEGLSPPAFHGFSLGVILLTPRSRGKVTLASRDPFDKPLIDPNYLSDPEGDDLRRLLHGMRVARRIAGRPPLSDESAEETHPGSPDDSDASLERSIRAAAHTIYHPVGTCRMGQDAGAVVGPDLALRGVGGLWIADASVMPSVPRGHPNAVVAAIADRAAGLIANARTEALSA